MSFVPKNHPQQVRKNGPHHLTDDRRTPPDLLAECSALVGGVEFNLDVASNGDNAVCQHFYTPEESGLSNPWFGNVWCNPPYSDIRAWVEKAIDSREDCDSITMLLPANRTEQAWWHDLIEDRRVSGRLSVFFLRGRRRFYRPGWTAPKKGDRPPFGLCIVHMKQKSEWA